VRQIVLLAPGTLHAEDLPAGRAGNGQMGIERLVSQRGEVKTPAALQHAAAG